MKVILWLHRYLGVAVGLLMVLWCLSGFVMMYQGWPRLTPDERIQGLPPFGPDERRGPLASPLAGDAALNSFRVEMLNGALVLRTAQGAVDLETGAAIAELDEAAGRAAALQYAAGNDLGAAVERAELIDYDQWSIQERRMAPFWQVRLDGPRDAILYVSQRTGEVAQSTTGHERFWNWLGAIPHWLYPRILREHSGTWVQVVIWTSALGCFLTVTGLYVGIAKFRKRPNGSWSPYRKVWLWHHYTGLIFGILTLTWVFSGLLTMGPFWPMQGRPFPEAFSIGGAVDDSDSRALIQAALARPDADGMVQLESAPLAGEAFAIAHYADGGRLRLDVSGAEAPLSEADIQALLGTLGAPFAGGTAVLQTEEDAWYYGHHREAELPVWRIETSEESPRTVYLSAQSGRLLNYYDNGGRWHRWLEAGLHSFDFLRIRPLWDLVVLPLLAGVTLLCGIGLWLSIDRVRKDWRMATRGRRARAANPARAASVPQSSSRAD